jgi:hypothetical protein
VYATVGRLLSMNGYAAPEDVKNADERSSRSPLVEAFGDTLDNPEELGQDRSRAEWSRKERDKKEGREVGR